MRLHFDIGIAMSPDACVMTVISPATCASRATPGAAHVNVAALRVVRRAPVAGADGVGVLRLALLQNLRDAIIIARRAKLVLEILLRRRAEETLCALGRRQDLEGCKERKRQRSLLRWQSRRNRDHAH